MGVGVGRGGEMGMEVWMGDLQVYGVRIGWEARGMKLCGREGVRRSGGLEFGW
jgi:hypothetical protein